MNDSGNEGLACVALPRQITVERVAFDGANYEAHIDGLTQQVP